MHPIDQILTERFAALSASLDRKSYSSPEQAEWQVPHFLDTFSGFVF